MDIRRVLRHTLRNERCGGGGFCAPRSRDGDSRVIWDKQTCHVLKRGARRGGEIVGVIPARLLLRSCWQPCWIDGRQIGGRCRECWRSRCGSGRALTENRPVEVCQQILKLAYRFEVPWWIQRREQCGPVERGERRHGWRICKTILAELEIQCTDETGRRDRGRSRYIVERRSYLRCSDLDS